MNKYVAFAFLGAIVGVVFMTIYTLSTSVSASTEIQYKCKQTDFYSVSGATVTRVFDCSGITIN